jgi:iron complex transport system substrate-binding protein
LKIGKLRQNFIDRTARKPQGERAKKNYRDPKAHYKSFKIILEKLNLNEDDNASLRAFHESILNRPELATVRAVQNRRVYVINSELPVTSVIGFAYFAKWLYLDRFTDLDPQAIHQEYLDRFMRIDYDLDERGTFAYPKP